MTIALAKDLNLLNLHGFQSVLYFLCALDSDRAGRPKRQTTDPTVTSGKDWGCSSAGQSQGWLTIDLCLEELYILVILYLLPTSCCRLERCSP